jgi:predicted signal transduction protein with EAL and GGDEF domain
MFQVWRIIIINLMSDTSVTRILILAEVEIGRRWEEILRGPETLVWLGRAAIPPGEHPEIILADACVPQAASGRAAVRDEVGVVLVGGDGPADVYLGADCSAEELCGACRLLGEIVRLRRRAVQAAQTNRELTEAAMTDPLTGLANRRAWDLELARRIKGDSPHLCAAPSGPFRQMGTVPFYDALEPTAVS